MRDGSSDEWLEEGEATHIISSASNFGFHSSGHDSSICGDVIDGESNSSSGELVGRWHQFLGFGEKQLFAGLVWKRKVRRRIENPFKNP